MLGRTPKLDIASLQRKMISGGRGGYCLEQNMLFREGLLCNAPLGTGVGKFGEHSVLPFCAMPAWGHEGRLPH